MDAKFKWGNIINQPPTPYIQPADLNKKQEKAEIKVKLPDRTNYQMASFCSRNNKDYITLIIAMRRLLEKKETKKGVAKAFKLVEELKDSKLGPLTKRLNMSKLNVEKEELKLQIASVKEEMKKTRIKALMDIIKAYELIHLYFVGEAWTQWDKIVQEMHGKDP